MEEHRKAFPDLSNDGVKTNKNDDESETEISLKGFFLVILVGSLLFAGISTYAKDAEPIEVKKPRHLQQKEAATPTPAREVRGYSLSY